MSAFDPASFATALPLTEGLLTWTQRQSPDTWHEIARRAEFAAPGATIDLLLTLHWISRQPSCDRATALLILTRAAEAGLQGRDCPGQMEPKAAKAFCKALYKALRTDGFARKDLALTPIDLAAIDAHLGPDGAFPLTPLQRRNTGTSPHHPACDFARQRPVMRPLAA